MHDVIVGIENILVKLYPIPHLLLVVGCWFAVQWAVRLWRKSDSLAIVVLPVLLVTLGYGNFLLGAGRFIGEGDLLETLSLIHYLLYSITIPFFIVVGIEIAHEAKAWWANRIIRALQHFPQLFIAVTTVGAIVSQSGF